MNNEQGHPEQRPPWKGALTVVEAAAIANKSRWAITHAIREGALPATRVGHPRTGAYFIDIDDLRRVYPPETRDSSKRARLKRMLSGNEFTESIAFAEKRLSEIEE